MRYLLLCFVAALLAASPVSHALDTGTALRSNTMTMLASADDKSKEKDKDKDKDKDKGDTNKGGAGVGPPTVHGCDSSGCWNNGPHEPTPPKKKCHKDKSGIEICE